MAEAFLNWGGGKPNDQIFSPTIRTGSGVARNLKRGGIFPHFFKRILFGRTNLKLIKKLGKFSGSPGACSPGKFLKIYML